MLQSTNGPLTFLRFGVQRKKEFLRDVRKAYDGLVLPANILLYQYRSTPTAILLCGKPYFVDPMSYLFGQPYSVFKQTAKFKPSFHKLMIGHGLDPEAFFPRDYRELLRFLARSDSNIATFTENCLEFQWSSVWSAIDSSRDLMSEQQKASLREADFRPRLLIPPYFLYDASTGGGETQPTSLNRRIIEYCGGRREQGQDIFPMVYLKREHLTNGFIDQVISIATSRSFPGYCVWIESLDEASASQSEISGLIRLVRALSNSNRQVVMMHGGFFSLLLHFHGANCVAHGLAYGETRSGVVSAQGGGPAPIRYYIVELHRFLTLENALIILRERPDLICSCPVCQRVIGGDPERVTNYADQESLAEMHFLINRARERKMIASASYDEAIRNLEWTENLTRDIVTITKRFKTYAGYEERPILDPSYIGDWVHAMQASRP